MRVAVIAIVIMGLPIWAAAQTCPLGASNDPYPGQCGAYHDANQDGICDFSQAGPDSTAELAASAGFKFPDYNLWEIMLAVLVLAAATEILSSRKRRLIFRLQTVWNWILLLSFVLCAVSGLYFVLPPSSRPSVGLNLSFWHTETGLVFAAAGLYHAIRRIACMFRGLKA